MLATRNTSTLLKQHILQYRTNGENRLYQSQLALSERHLDSLLGDTSSALDLLASLSESFQTVESQTTAFQAQCEDLLAEQKKLRDLADEIGTDLQYYAYLEPLTRRLNTPGSGRLARNDDFLDMLRNLNTCIDFMDQHVSLYLPLHAIVRFLCTYAYGQHLGMQQVTHRILAPLPRRYRLQVPLSLTSREIS